MSVRLYVGNLPQSFDTKELEALFASVGEGIRFKAVQDRETGAGRGFGFANINDEKVADAVIEQLLAASEVDVNFQNHCASPRALAAADCRHAAACHL